MHMEFHCECTRQYNIHLFLFTRWRQHPFLILWNILPLNLTTMSALDRRLNAKKTITTAVVIAQACTDEQFELSRLTFTKLLRIKLPTRKNCQLFKNRLKTNALRVAQATALQQQRQAWLELNIYIIVRYSYDKMFKNTLCSYSVIGLENSQQVLVEHIFASEQLCCSKLLCRVLHISTILQIQSPHSLSSAIIKQHDTNHSTLTVFRNLQQTATLCLTRDSLDLVSYSINNKCDRAYQIKYIKKLR